MNGNGLLTIKEASELTGINQTTIYRKINKGQLHATAVQVHGVEIKKVKKEDIITLFGNSKNRKQLHATAMQVQETATQLHATAVQMPSSEERKAEIREVIEEFFSVKQAELVKPIEQQSLYRLGRIEQENQFLKVKVETLLQEIEKYKALPWQIQERDEEIKELEARYQKEKEEILREYETKLLKAEEDKIRTEESLKEKLNILPAPAESINQILMENAHNLKILHGQKEELAEKLRQQKQEKEKALKELEANQQREKTELQAKLKAEAKEAQRKKEEIEANLKTQVAEKARVMAQAEKEKTEMEAKLKEAEAKQIEISEAWKKKVDELSRPWWKFW